MVIKLHNTLTGEKEIFTPIEEGVVKMYNCGPTVYDYVHIGNLRSYTFADILRRTFEYNDYKVLQVMNITDVGHLRSDADEGEDKMTGALKREGKPLNLESLKELADFYIEAFIKNLDAMNIERPTLMPKASENIREDIELIQKLEEKGFVYTTSDGVYFDTSKDEDYGVLGGLNLDAAEDRSRIEQNPEKRSPQDFALWKFNNELGWESPWGGGFPGWHIECSAMSMKFLGQTFDVHTGGIDHIPVHHNNEIAQSESATGKPLAHYWLHNAHLKVSDGKMAKSAGNFLKLQDLEEKGVSPLAYRYWLLTSHYRSPVNLNFEALEGAETALRRLAEHLAAAPESNGGGTINPSYEERFRAFINDDLDTPRALALIWELIKDSAVSPADKYVTILDFDRVLGLNLKTLSDPTDIPAEITSLAAEREIARKNKDFVRSDELRAEIEEKGFEIKDSEDTYKISKK